MCCNNYKSSNALRKSKNSCRITTISYYYQNYFLLSPLQVSYPWGCVGFLKSLHFQSIFLNIIHLEMPIHLGRYITKQRRELSKNRSCIGCCDKPQPIIAVDEPSKGLRIQGQVVKKPSISDDFWSTSTCDMENSTLQSQRSFSSISVSNQSLSGTGSASNHSEFVNHGLLLWNQSRLQWLGTKNSQIQGKVQEPVLSWNASYESLLGTSKRFPQPIPLCEMVDFLVDIWDQEGLYD